MTKQALMILLGGTLLTACGTPYKKTAALTAAGATVGALYGASRPEYQKQNALMDGALGALAAGTASLLFDMDEVNPEKTKLENQKLKAKLDEFQRKLEPQLTGEGKNLFSSPLPKEVAGLVEPGEWKRYRMDQWVVDPNDPNVWVRQVEMIEIIPPVAR